MLIKNKQSKKELVEKIEALEKENKTLKTTINQEIQENELFLNLSNYLQTEKLDILTFSPNQNVFDLLSPNQSLNVLLELPENLESLIDLINIDDRENFNVSLKKIDTKPSALLRTKLHLQKDEVKELKPIEIVFISTVSEKIIIVIKDITEINRQKRELSRIKDKIEASDRLKTTLLSNISHQIRTPLNSITGFSELLAGDEPNKIKRREYISIIKRQSKRILNLIDDISEVSKLESGTINISKIACDLNLFLNELLLGLNQQRSFNRKELVALELKLPENAPNTEILSDSGRLQQVLLNIINYSLRYTQQGKIEFGYTIDEPNQKIDFYVKDSSDGLTKDEQKIIFNRFMVIDNSENTKMEDPGLGLTIAREIIKAMGGKIWVESEKEVGTSFYFNIPYEKSITTKDEVVSEIYSEEPYNFANKVILIVDDEDVNAMFLDAVFQGTGAQTLFAKNGLQALELVNTINKIDLILMDMKMPVMNGIKSTQEIRKTNITIPIIAQTALASEEDKHNAKIAGCNYIITKPIEVEEMLQLANSFLHY